VISISDNPSELRQLPKWLSSRFFSTVRSGRVDYIIGISRADSL